jgi:hypothetical protein
MEPLSSCEQDNSPDCLIANFLHGSRNHTPNPTTYFVTTCHQDSESGHDALFSNRNIHNTAGFGPFDDNTGICYGISFFIGERKTHYNELKQYVFWPLASLEPAQTDTKIFQNFFDRFRFIMAYNPESYVIQYGKALMHMQKEAPDLPKQIGSFYKDVESLNKDVDALETLVKDTIHSAFIKNPAATIKEYYKYSLEGVLDVVMSVWNQILNENPHNVCDAIKNLPIEELKIEVAGDTIRMRVFRIGEGNDEERAEMTDIIFNKIIKNEIIFNQISNMFRQSKRPELVKRMNSIKNRSQEISNMLDAGTIHKAKCCPTIWNLIEKYVL